MRSPHKSLILLLMAALTLWGGRFAVAATNPVHAEHAIVVSVHELASRAGSDIMRAGGNAVDAAVATGFALAVVHPPAGNLGGGGFMLMRMADGKVHFLDYREKAPAAAKADMYLDAQGNVIEDASVIGYKAIGVPGSVAGMVTTSIWASLPSRDESSSATAITTSPARFSASLTWRGLWSELPRSPMTFITAQWRGSWLLRCRRAEG